MSARLDLDFERGLHLSQATDFSFVDDATPLGIDDSAGSTGSMHVNFDRQNIRPALMKGLKGQGVILSPTEEEERSIGVVSHVSGSNSGVGIDIDSIALRLAVKRNAKPFTGTLAGGLRYWARLVGIPADRVEVEPAIAGQQVALVGFSDNVWLRIKQFCAAVGIEVVVRDNDLVVRRPRPVVVNAQRLTAKSWEVDDSSLAQIIQVSFYDPQTVVAGDVTPDYSRSNVPSGAADDPGGGLANANGANNQLPPGWLKISSRSIS